MEILANNDNRCGKKNYQTYRSIYHFRSVQMNRPLNRHLTTFGQRVAQDIQDPLGQLYKKTQDKSAALKSNLHLLQNQESQGSKYFPDLHSAILNPDYLLAHQNHESILRNNHCS